MCADSIRVWNAGTPKLEQSDVVITCDEERRLRGRLEVHGKLAVLWHATVDGGWELKHKGLQDRMLLDVPHFHHLKVTKNKQCGRSLLAFGFYC